MRHSPMGWEGLKNFPAVWCLFLVKELTQGGGSRDNGSIHEHGQNKNCCDVKHDQTINVTK